MNDNPAQNDAPNIAVEKEQTRRELKTYAGKVAIAAILSSAVVLIIQPNGFAVVGVMFIMSVTMLICLALLYQRPRE